MKLVIISPLLYPCSVGGIELFNYYLAIELAKHENCVKILTTCKDKSESDPLEKIILNERLLGNNKLSLLVDIFLNILKCRDYDIFHIPYTSNSPIVYPFILAKMLFSLNYIIVIHGGGLRPWKPKLLHKSFFDKANAIVAVSEPIKKEYEIRSGRSIRVLPPLIPFRRSQMSKINLRRSFGFECDEKILICLGSIKKIKGSDILLEAFLKLGTSYIEDKKLRLVYAGDGPMKNVLEEKIGNFNYQNYVKFLGNVSHNKVPDLFKLADIYILPSFFEGASISLFEAMFNGLPIIATDTSGINNVIINRENGLTFKKLDVQDLSKSIRLLIEDKSLANMLGCQAYLDYDSKYNYESLISEHIKLYKNLI